MPVTLRECLVEDLRMWGVPVSDASSWLVIARHAYVEALFRHSFACVLYYRINVRLKKRFPRIARLFGVWRYYRFGNDISYYADIGPGFKINHTSDIVIGKGVVIGRRFNVYNGVTVGAKRFDAPNEKPVVLDDVTIGTGAKVLGNITVGNHATIGALTLCTVSVPDRALAVGNPVRIIEHHESS